MTIGNSPQRTHRAYAAPRRRFRSEDDAGYLGDAPILLNLPNLCGVPDLDEEREEVAPASTPPSSTLPEAAEPTSKQFSTDDEKADPQDVDTTPQVFAPATTPTPAPIEHDYGHHALDEEEEDSEHSYENNSTENDTPRLSTPDFVTSSASMNEGADEEPLENSGQDETESDQYEDDECDEYDEEPMAATSRSNVHRKVIMWTALFVAAASLYMYVNRDQQPVATPATGLDVELGWEDDPFTDESYGTEAPILEPAYGAFGGDSPGGDALQGQAGTNVEPISSTTPSSGMDVGNRLPGPTDTATDFQIQRVRPRGQADTYPETKTPEAAYEVTENPSNIRTSMRPESGGPTSSLDGISPMTPTSGATYDQPY